MKRQIDDHKPLIGRRCSMGSLCRDHLSSTSERSNDSSVNMTKPVSDYFEKMGITTNSLNKELDTIILEEMLKERRSGDIHMTEKLTEEKIEKKLDDHVKRYLERLEKKGNQDLDVVFMKYLKFAKEMSISYYKVSIENEMKISYFDVELWFDKYLSGLINNFCNDMQSVDIYL